MSSKTRVRLTPSQRFGRGLKYSTVGPVDVTRGAVGMGVNSVRSSASWVGQKYRSSKVAHQVQDQIAAAQEAIVNLPETLEELRAPKRRHRPRLIALTVGLAVLAGGAVAFSIVRRSTQPEPSPLPPSVEVTPKP
ncbi:cell wall synthesis protein CwsA [Mycolicibacterium sp. 018/SC-01/001]|uniref:cell wall synthesis protein CwsA n=1 Tax=Mycolicibacterium sp. 018/SC-01/001 TaxID=2592069 RepID=UPI00117F7017|nr:cell wall synthesis protein CwsA [Mycolicibacterium sp. 018/SC-01/001]TRW89239.1 cell wall synthesis protein CwsA [Mycolicibacterium sp. 018/SC-01/001]